MKPTANDQTMTESRVPGDTFSSSLWETISAPAEVPVRLQDEQQAEVAIVGGGILGLSIALHLAERGVSTALLEAEKFGFMISIHSVPYNNSSVVKIKQLFDSRSIDGVIVNGLSLKNSMLTHLVKSKVPFVTVGYHEKNFAYPMINCQPLNALQTMVKVLEQKKYQEIIYVSGNIQFYDGVLQKEDLLKALKGSSIKLCQEFAGDFSRKSGYLAAIEIFKNEISKKTVVFLANDLMAAGFYRYAYEHQIAIPNKIGVIGSDDEVISRTLFPELATIRQPRLEMGAVSVRELLALIKRSGDKIVSDELSVVSEDLPCEFVERGSI